jgi:glutamate racemase
MGGQMCERLPGLNRCVGVFDSGVGGLSVLREIGEQMPHEDIVYVADQANIPYGARSLSEVRRLAGGIVQFLRRCGAKIIVIACNTASAAALYDLRSRHPDIRFVGMEPALKPAVENTKVGVVGVIATPVTFMGAPYAKLAEKYRRKAVVVTRGCAGLVEAVEAGAIDTANTRALVEECLRPLADAGVDQLVLGCTHYPFLRPIIEEVMGPATAVVDPSAAVARQVGRVLSETGEREASGRNGSLVFYTTGDAGVFAQRLSCLLPNCGRSADVRTAFWKDGALSAASN